MEKLLSWPWIEMFLATTLLPGLLAAIFLIGGKYPANRYLGITILIYGLCVLSIFIDFPLAIQWGFIASSATSFLLYTSAFFRQNTRIKSLRLLPLAIVWLIALLATYIEIRAVLQIVAGIVVGYQLILVYNSLKVEGKQRGIDWSTNPGSRLKWFRNFVFVNAFLLVFLFASTLLGFTWQTILGYFFVLVMLLQRVFSESTFSDPLLLDNKYKKSTLTPHQKSSIAKKFDEVFIGEKLFLENGVSLSDLALKINTSTHHLSQVINETKGISFQELTGKYRIREAMTLLKNPEYEKTKIENIAALVGYYSKSAFNSAFKKHTGFTPSAFKQLKDVRSDREAQLPDRNTPHSPVNLFSWYHELTKLNDTLMVKNFLKIFYRTLVRNKFFASINLFGLTVGFTASILIYLFLQQELSYENQLPGSEQIARISWINENPQTRTPHPMAQAMVQHFPEVSSAVSLSPWYGQGLNKQTIRVKKVNSKEVFEEPDFYFADSTFFDVFDLNLIAGDIKALHKPWNIVITKPMALKYFGKSDAVGERLSVNDMPVEIAAVVESMPKLSHFHFQAIISYVTLKAIGPDNPWLTWKDFGHFNYIKVVDGTDLQELEAKIPDFVLPHLDWDDAYATSLLQGTRRFRLQPIKDIHLRSHLRWELEPNGNILYVYILLGSLFFILVIAIINYVNLTTAKSAERAKEIGIRKTLGSGATSLSAQFYFEALLFCLISLFLAFILAYLCLDYFNALTNKSFSPTSFLNFGFVAKAVVGGILFSLLAGVYPALSLTSIRPSEILKGKFSNSIRGNKLRNSLVTLQFTVSAILIVASLIILKQINFMKTKELGFDQEAVISLNVHPSVAIGGIDLNKLKSMQEQLTTIPGVKMTSAVSNLPGAQFNQNPIFLKEDPQNRIDASGMAVDFNAVELLGLELVDGRSFDRKYADDKTAKTVLINETVVRSLNLKHPLGKTIVWENENVNEEFLIVGIIKDFHYKSLHEPIQSLLVHINPSGINHLVVRLEGQQFQSTLATMKGIYEKFEKELPFEYHFLDEQLAQLYQAEIRTLNIFSIFTGIALVLACLGLLGIAIATLNQKIKEVGVRKILGASSGQIILLVILRFSKLITIALLLGLPISYWLMKEWLGEFSYQTQIGIFPFILAMLILALVAIGSVITVVIKIAKSNPVNALRHE